MKDIKWHSELYVAFGKKWPSSIAVRVPAYCAKDPRFETHLELRVGRSLTAHPAALGR